MIARALTIAGSDPSGGAGIQADLKTFHRFGVYGMSALTLVTVQNTMGVTRVDVLDPSLVSAQIDAVLSDIGAGAVKTGALGSVEVIRAVVQALPAALPLVVDPVMISKHGAPLLHAEAVEVMTHELLPRASLLMPNLPEAAALLGRSLPMEDAVQALHKLGPRAVLLKGGHSVGPDANDLFFDGTQMAWLNARRVDTVHTHGTGCTYSAAVTALLAKGCSLLDAAIEAKAFIARAIASAPGLGRGQGPVDHFA